MLDGSEPALKHAPIKGKREDKQIGHEVEFQTSNKIGGQKVAPPKITLHPDQVAESWPQRDEAVAHEKMLKTHFGERS